MARVLISVPKPVPANESFEVKILISHPMESGQRRDAQGRAIPREIIRSLSCDIDGATVFDADLHPAISANPFLSFMARAARSGTLRFRFVDDLGVSQTETVPIVVA
jgi:sulfur-oxidizing protein SoxZ